MRRGAGRKREGRKDRLDWTGLGLNGMEHAREEKCVEVGRGKARRKEGGMKRFPDVLSTPSP